MKIETIHELEKLYGLPSETSLGKEVDHISDEYRLWIEASPFAALATVGPEGLDCSPRGDRIGELVRIADRKSILMPDRRGNNRTDSLKNIIRDPRIGLMFLIPGYGNALRINGKAFVDDDLELRQSFAVGGQAPRSVIIIGVEAVFFQCARAIIRSNLWNIDRVTNSGSLPSPGTILEKLSAQRVDGRHYDEEWPERAAKTMW